MLRNYEQTILKMKKKTVSNLKEKDIRIDDLTNQLERLKFNIRGCN